ncbi:DNA polymerase I-like flap endonuclease (FEN) [Acaryochloris phage A-HIS2]|nr:DNA polymerase I-like flap endonuclease (FEN) [Acaryochloris phage A-HIS2]
MINPENIFQHANTGVNPLLILDFRVLCWKIYPVLDNFIGTLYDQIPVTDPSTGVTEWALNNDGSRQSEVEQFIKLAWISLLNRGPDMIPGADYTVIVVDDTKRKSQESGKMEYWRHKFLRNHWKKVKKSTGSLPTYRKMVKQENGRRKRMTLEYDLDDLEYKGGRSEKPKLWQDVAKIGLSYISKKTGFYYFSQSGYEADDFAGAIVAHKRSPGASEVLRNRDVFLYTVDRDWLQLVGDGVYWCNTGPWLPRLRDEEATLADVLKKEKVEISHPHGIVDAKVKSGDKSDNLPAGSPREVIDLLSPPKRYDLKRKPIFKTLEAACNDYRGNIDFELCVKATDAMMIKGYPLVITSKPYAGNF